VSRKPMTAPVNSRACRALHEIATDIFNGIEFHR
jgi:hypothetical protein